MMPVKQGWMIGIVLIGFAWLGAGCSSSTAPDGQANARSETEAAGRSLLTASIDDDDDDEDLDDGEDSPAAGPTEGTPEWHIREILKIRLLPYPAAAKSSDAQTGGDEAVASDERDDLAPVRRERNLKVIELAKQAIALTHNQPDKEVVFNAAVNHLLDARLQLALAGEQSDVDALYEIAEALQNSKPNSEAAMSAALTVVNFAHANAVRYAETEPRWIQEFARQAQLFASRVSDSLAASTPEDGGKPSARRAQLLSDASRAAQVLMAAGQSCEAAGFSSDAKACYTLIKTKFGETVQAQHVAGILRRMQLKGQPLQLAGPTLDGNFLSIDDFQGKTVLVVFWSSDAQPFLEQLPSLVELLKKAHKHVSVIGVCLDTDESRLDNFLEEHDLNWPQIFFSEPEKRGWNSPLAAYYGITQLPTVWIVDPSGVVAETEVPPAELEAKLKDVVRRGLATNKSGVKGAVRPAAGTAADQ
jgi:peroxiredoxin